MEFGVQYDIKAHFVLLFLEKTRFSVGKSAFLSLGISI